MDEFKELAEEMIGILDRITVKPSDPISANMRGEMAVLRLLNMRDGPMTAGCISRQVNMTTSRIAAVLNSLEKKQMIDRLEDENDRRRVLVHLTDKGRTFARERRAELMEQVARMFAYMGREDAQSFVRLNRKAIGIIGMMSERGELIEPPTACSPNPEKR